MKIIRKLLLSYAIVLSLLILLSLSAFAHSGGTDAQGGHKDNKNVSGLGSYHYHHGKGPHLHNNGVCPYNTSSASNKNMSVSSSDSNIKIVSATASNISKSVGNSGGNSIGTFILGGVFSLGALGVIRKIWGK